MSIAGFFLPSAKRQIETMCCIQCRAHLEAVLAAFKYSAETDIRKMLGICERLCQGWWSSWCHDRHDKSSLFGCRKHKSGIFGDIQGILLAVIHRSINLSGIHITTMQFFVLPYNASGWNNIKLTYFDSTPRALNWKVRNNQSLVIAVNFCHTYKHINAS